MIFKQLALREYKYFLSKLACKNRLDVFFTQNKFMNQLSLKIIQKFSLQLSTSLALEEGLDEVHEIVRLHENNLLRRSFSRDIQSLFFKSNKKGLFNSHMPAADFLKNDRDLLRQVIDYAARRHQGEYRDSGHPYLSHVLSTGFLLSRLGFPKEIVMAGILHDTLEDAPDKLKVLNELNSLKPELAFYVFSVSGPDIRDSVEKDKQLFSRIQSFSSYSDSIFPAAIKCFDSMANLYDLEGMQAKDGRSASERQRHFLQNTSVKIIPFARSIDEAGCVRVNKGKEIFSVEEYIAEIIENKLQSIS
jgi:(p)ppGpp synthase/HD superfamily hydrolase